MARRLDSRTVALVRLAAQIASGSRNTRPAMLVALEAGATLDDLKSTLELAQEIGVNEETIGAAASAIADLTSCPS